MQWTQDGHMMPARSESVSLNDRTTASRKKKKKREPERDGERGNKRELCAIDETPWETKEATSEVVVGGVKCAYVCVFVCVCVCVCRRGLWGGSITRQESAEILEVVFAFSI